MLIFINNQKEIKEDVLAVSCECPLVVSPSFINKFSETKEYDERIKVPLVVASDKIQKFFSQKRDKDIDIQISNVKEKLNIEMPIVENNMSLRLKKK